MNNYSIKKPLVKGSNNGTIGFGMGRGSLFPPSMNGPFGFINHPLPLRYDFPTNLQLNSDTNPSYNDPERNAPSYNTDFTDSITGYNVSEKLPFNNPFNMKQSLPYSEINANFNILFGPIN